MMMYAYISQMKTLHNIIQVLYILKIPVIDDVLTNELNKVGGCVCYTYSVLYGISKSARLK